MNKEYRLYFNLNNYISVEEPYEDDYGCVLFGVVDDDSGMLNLLYQTDSVKQINFFIDLIKHVTNLETKLMEQSLRIEELESQYGYECECNKQFVECQNENEELKQQLAEKEKQIETQKSNIEFLYDLFVSPQGEQTLKAINQNKISFAVEQLEQVKAELVNNVSPVKLSYTDYVQEVFNKLDNQIKQLKEGK